MTIREQLENQKAMIEFAKAYDVVYEPTVSKEQLEKALAILNECEREIELVLKGVKKV